MLLFLLLGFTGWFYLSRFTIPRERFKAVWKRSHQKSEFYVPEIVIGDLWLAILFPFTFISRARLSDYCFFANMRPICKEKSYNGLSGLLDWVERAYMLMLLVPVFVLGLALMPLLFGLMGLYQIVLRTINPPDITEEDIKRKLMTESVPQVFSLPPEPAKGSWECEEYPEPQKVSIQEIVN